MTVAGSAFDFPRLVMVEHYGTKNNGTTWNGDGLPAKWIQIPGESSGAWYKEILQRVEVIGLEGDETFQVEYGRTGNYARTLFSPKTQGDYVLEEDFEKASYKWTPDYCSLEFFKDFDRTRGG